MKKIRDVFYIAQKGVALDKGISGWTAFLAILSFDWKRLKFNVSHQEKWFPDENGEFYITGTHDNNFYGHVMGKCFSATMRGAAKGVRFDLAATVLRNPERWLVAERWITDVQYDQMIMEAKDEVGKKYDFLGIGTGFFMLARYLQNDNKRYCSDICHWLDWVVGLIKRRYWIISPRHSARLLEKQGVKIVPLTELLK